MTSRVLIPALLIVLASAQSPTPVPGPSGRRPANPANRTVFGLRPYEIPGLNDKDTADAAGDLYFYLTDKVMMPFMCREDPSFPLCNSSKIIAGNNVYQQTLVEVDSDQIGEYALCNPATDDPSGHTWQCRPSSPQFGVGNISQMYGNCTVVYHNHTYNLCKTQAWSWRVQAANYLPGLWFSTQAVGNCDNDNRKQCYWRVAEQQLIKNATCVNDKIDQQVVRTGQPCFDHCGPSGTDRTSDCYAQCYFTTLLGNRSQGVLPMPAGDVLGIFADAFASEDASKGGCPSLPPYQPSPAPPAAPPAAAGSGSEPPIANPIA